MQEVSGIPFQKYVQEKVLEPLEMNHTIAPDILNERSRYLNSYDEKFASTFCTKNRLGGFREAIPVDNFYKLASGGYLSTSEDIAKFGQANLDGKVLTKKIRSEFLTSRVLKGSPTYYGLGWQVSEDKKGRSYYGHVGNGVGGYSNFFVYSDERMVFSLLINCTDPKVQDELDEIVDLIFSNYRSKPVS